MARGAAPGDDDSSSSGFSSDEDMADLSDLPSAASYTPNVHVEVLHEEVEVAQESAPTDAHATPETPTAPSDVLQCCQEAAEPILRTPQPLDVSYEQFTTAIAHVTWHWPTSESPDLDQRLVAYHSLRAELYEAFQRAFPLTEDMYTQWIGDAEARGDKPLEIKKLFELAHRDYWSVPLTLQYLKYLREEGVGDELEKTMNKAQSTVGMHFARGHEVWALCRELTAEKFGDEEEDGELKKEKAIRELFCKQMQLPLDQNDLVMSEFRAWDAYNTLDAEASGSAFEDASKRQSTLFAPLMKKLRGFEARVNAAPGTEDAAAPEQAWQQYLNFVKHRVAPLMASEKTGGASEQGRQLVACLYERAVAVMCLSPSLWASYLEYLEPSQDDEDSGRNNLGKLPVARRAVRNVPFDSSAWTEYLIEMERQKTPNEAISEFVQTELLARSSPPMDQFHLLNVLLTWCDSMRRRASMTIIDDDLDRIAVESMVKRVFSDCEQFIMKTFPDFLGGRVRLTEYQAKCYWLLMNPEDSTPPDHKHTMKARKVAKFWQDKLDTCLGDRAASWIAFLGALRYTNAYSVTAMRSMVFDQAVERVKDSPLVLAEAWLAFEREFGGLRYYLRARRYHTKHRSTAQVTTSMQVPAASATADTAPAGTDKKAKPSKKRKANAGDKPSKNSQKQPPAKRAKAQETSVEEAGAPTAMVVDETKKAKSAEKKKAHESLTNEHTLFLCNVDKEASQEDIEALFRDIPTLKDVRLVVKTRGDRVKSRGMAYVQFTDEAGVEEGLKQNGCLLHGHPLRVERSKPPPTSASTPGGKPAATQSFWKTDPLTLYVGDLNRDDSKDQVTEEQLQISLQQAMQAAGQLVVVRRVSILKDRYGKLKNYGLVEVAEPSQAEFCLANAPALQAKLGEQVTMKPSRFSITHILEQQEKQQKQKQQRKANPAASTGRGAVASKGANAPHARPSTRLNLPSSGSATSLMPRALRRKLAAQSNAPKTEPSEAASDATTATVTPKSNEDFRKMLFSK